MAPKYGAYRSYAKSKAARAQDVQEMIAADRAAAIAAARASNPMEGVDYPTRDYPQQRHGYGSVARTRGAGVTGEMKYFDCELQAAAIQAVTTTWISGTRLDPTTTINLGDAAVANPSCLCVPKVSASLNGRIGRKIKVLKIKVNGTISVPEQAGASAADSATKIRLVLVQDMQSNASSMTPALLFNDAGAADTTICSFQNPNNFGRFRVLKDKIIQLGNASMTGAAPTIVQSGMKYPFKFVINFKEPITVNFNATNGGTVTDIIDNSFHIICGADNVALAPTLSYYSRCSYKE